MPEEKGEYLTKEKYDKLSEELADLKKNRRREIAENLEYAKSLGDLSENAEYQEARELQASIEERILKLENVLKNAEIVSVHKTDKVGVGSVVTVKKEEGGDSKTYTVVGSEESNTLEGKISNRSPLGEAMLGKKKGEAFSFNTPKGAVKYKIVSIK